ncbi:SLBB domain-containing protein [candidate division WOR-3 bacterium]|nr:SLBB domain-containing protein [candidate division WOR-3 bacterium]
MMMICLIIFNISASEVYIKGDVSIRIQVWGEVQSPGMYQVPPTTNLVEALSFAGGPTSEGDISMVKLVRVLKKEKIVFYDVNDYMDGKGSPPPIMDSGDLIFVPRSLSSRIWDFVRFTSIVAGVSWSVYMIVSR